MPVNASTAMTRRQRGMSLVELMVGIAIGLIIVAGATVLAVAQLTENRLLLLETQVHQDLRATLDIITRELRRAGHNPNPDYYWMPNAPTILPVQNGMATVDLNVPNRAVSYQYWRGSNVISSNEFAYSLSGGAIRSHIGTTVQDLTDRNTLEVLEFKVERVLPIPAPVQIACPKLCANGTQACWPTTSVIDLKVSIKGRAAFDDTIVRTVSSQVRVRNDNVRFAAASPACPP